MITGRHEKIILADKKIKSMLEDMPSICKDFYYSTANYSYNTKITYIRSMKNFLLQYRESKSVGSLLDNHVFQITSNDINQYFTYLRSSNSALSSSSIATKYSSLKAFFDFIVKQGYMSKNPMEQALSRPRVRQLGTVTYLEKDEIQILLNNIEHGVGSHKAKKHQEKWRTRDRLIFMIFLSTGIRVSALDDVNISNLDIEKQTFKVIEKGYKEREFELDKKVYQLLMKWLEERESLLDEHDQQCDALFLTKYQGEYKRMTIQSIQNIVKKFTQGINKKISPHKLRATYATLIYRKTGDIYLTADMLGHSDTGVTKRYAVTDKKQISEVNKSVINEIFN